MKLIIDPNAFDDFDGTQEELDKLIEEIQNAFESGDLLENAEPIEEDDPIWQQIQNQINPQTRH